MKTKSLSPIRKTLFTCVYIIVLFVLFEGCFRLYMLSMKMPFSYYNDRYFNARSGKTVFQPHPYLPYALKPGADRTIRVKMLFSPEKVPIDYKINSLGFRGPEITAEKGKGVYRIVCLGGSTTFGAILQDKCWVRRLEGLLSQHYPGRKIEVINAGVDGYTTADSLVNLSLRVLPLKPDAVIIYHGMNDAFGAFAVNFKPDYSHMRKDIPSEPLLIDYLPEQFEKSVVFSFIRYRLFRSIRENNLQALAYKKYSDTNLKSNAGYDTFDRNITSMVRLASSYGASVILSSFNYCDETEVFGRKFQLNKENDIIKRIAENEGVIFVDNFNAVSKSREAHSDTVHFSEEGHRQMAHSFYEAIVENELIGYRKSTLIARK